MDNKKSMNISIYQNFIISNAFDINQGIWR